MANQRRIALLTHTLFLPSRRPSHHRVGPVYSLKHVPAHESQ